MRKLSLELIALPLLLVICFSSIVFAEASPPNAIVKATYSICGDGSVIISVWANTTDILACAIPVQGKVLKDTILASDPSGTPLDFEFNGTHIIVATANASMVYVRYAAEGLVSMNYDGSFVFHVKTLAPGDVLLPEGAALVDLEPQPRSIDFKGERIVLTYPAGADVRVTYMLVATPTAAPTTPVLTPPPTATPVQLTTPTAAPATTPTSPTTRPTETPAPILGGTVLLGAAIAIAAVIAVAAAFIIKKRGAGGGSVQVVFSSPGELDDRDKLILDTLKSKGPMSLSELSRATGISKSTLWRRVQRLKRMGYIVEERVGNKSLLKPLK